MKVIHLIVMIVAGVLLGLVLIAILPRTRPQPLIHFHQSPGKHPLPSPGPKSPAAEHAPEIIIVLGLGLAILFRKQESLVTMGGTIAMAGVTAFLGT